MHGAADCMFADFYGNMVVEVQAGGAASLQGSVFVGNSAVSDQLPGAILMLHSGAVEGNSRGATSAGHAGGFKLEGCAFLDNTVPHTELVLEGDATPQGPSYFSDSADVGLCSFGSQRAAAQAQCVATPLRPLASAPHEVFLPPEALTLLKEVSFRLQLRTWILRYRISS